ncbi:MAG: energy-coupling factor transporter ATPase [Anaerolineaceae bacterium]|nr:energy-coupling factor transporter ATPase [Anaerolineaceae bacterium]
MMDAIQVSDLSYQYPNASKPSLQNFSCAVSKGSFTVVMGETGAGKSTLLMSLNGVIPKMMEGTQSGDIKLEGQSILPYRVQTITEYVGLVMQDAETQILGRTVEEDVMFGPRNYRVPRQEILQRVEDSLARVRLQGYQKREATSLSGGEKQRLTIASILALKPQILLLDEPTSELDPLGREEIYTTINDLRSSTDLTILTVEHSSEDICEKADELLVMREGKLSWSGNPADFFRNLPLLEENGIKPLSVAVLGWHFMQAGLISPQQIPLSVEEAHALLQPLLMGKDIANPEPAPENHDESVISIEDLCFGYNTERSAIDHLTLKIQRGDFVAIIGQNGAGKTTLAKQLNGLLTPSSGKVFINGQNIVGKKPEEMASSIGYVFQNPDHQIFSTTVTNEILFGLKNTKLSQSEIESRVKEVLAFTGLEAFKDAHPFSMGKGERQKLAVASILALKPEILVVDEPTTGQDWNGIQVMMDMMKTLNENGTTIVMITHDMDVVSRYASQVILMNKGKLLLQGKTAEVLADTNLLQQASVTTTQTIKLCKALGLPVYLDEKALAQAIITSLNGGRA